PEQRPGDEAPEAEVDRLLEAGVELRHLRDRLELVEVLRAQIGDHPRLHAGAGVELGGRPDDLQPHAARLLAGGVGAAAHHLAVVHPRRGRRQEVAVQEAGPLDVAALLALALGDRLAAPRLQLAAHVAGRLPLARQAGPAPLLRLPGVLEAVQGDGQLLLRLAAQDLVADVHLEEVVLRPQPEAFLHRQVLRAPGVGDLALAGLLPLPLGAVRHPVGGAVVEADLERVEALCREPGEVLRLARVAGHVELVAEQLPALERAAPAREHRPHLGRLEGDGLLRPARPRRLRLLGRPRRRVRLTAVALGPLAALLLGRRLLLRRRLLRREQELPRQHDREGDRHGEEEPLALIFHLLYALSRRLLDRVVAAGEQRVAATEPPHRPGAPDQHALSLDRLDGVLRAGRQEPAGRHPLERGQEAPVEPHRRQRQRHRDPPQHAATRSRCCMRSRDTSARSMSAAERSAMMTTSRSAGTQAPPSQRACRTNSRSRRFTRFLVTALPIFLLTVIPTRPDPPRLTSTRKCRVRIFFPSPWTARYSRRLRSRAERGNR